MFKTIPVIVCDNCEATLEEGAGIHSSPNRLEFNHE